MSDRRPLRFWQPFNDWWRNELAKLGRRPNAQEIVDWYHHHAFGLWGNDAPTIQETRVHAKCLRSLPLVRDYFRTYRAKKRGGAGAHDSEAGGSPSKRKRSSRSKQATSEDEEEDEADEEAGQEEAGAGSMHHDEMIAGAIPMPHMPRAHYDMRAVAAHAAPALDYYYKPSRMPSAFRHDAMMAMPAHGHDRAHMARTHYQQYAHPWSQAEVAAHQQQEMVRNYMMMQAQHNVAQQQQAALAAMSQQYAAQRAAARSSQSSSALGNPSRRMAQEVAHMQMARQVSAHMEPATVPLLHEPGLGSPSAQVTHELEAPVHSTDSGDQQQPPAAAHNAFTSVDNSRRQPQHTSSEDVAGYACLEKGLQSRLAPIPNPLAHATSGQQSPVTTQKPQPSSLLNASPRPNPQLATSSPREGGTPRQKQQLEMLSKGQLMDLVLRLQQQKQQGGSPRPSPAFPPSPHTDAAAMPSAKRHDVHSAA